MNKYNTEVEKDLPTWLNVIIGIVIFPLAGIGTLAFLYGVMWVLISLTGWIGSW